MPNNFKYNKTGGEENSLFKGNWAIGIKESGMGPTSQSGFYNGVSAPSGGYTIYLEKSTNGPSIISVNDDNDLVFKTNRIFSTNFTSKEECLEYIDNDNSSICQRHPVEPIVTDGLVLNLDAKQVSSFSRQTTNPTWRDLSGENFTGNLENGPGFSEGIDKISFDGAMTMEI
jgi:hypothetical protein